jgi:hypothetical protein
MSLEILAVACLKCEKRGRGMWIKETQLIRAVMVRRGVVNEINVSGKC